MSQKFAPAPSFLNSLKKFAELIYNDPTWLEEHLDDFEYIGKIVGIGQILPGRLYFRVSWPDEPTSFMFGLTNDVWEAGFEIPSDFSTQPSEELLTFQADTGRLKASKIRISFLDLIENFKVWDSRFQNVERLGPLPTEWPILINNIVYQSTPGLWKWNTFGNSASSYYDVTELFRRFTQRASSLNYPQGFPGLPLNR